MASLNRETAASRVFGLAAILGLILISQDGQAVLSVALVAIIAGLAVYVSSTTALSPAVVATAEAGLVGLIIGLALPSGVILLPYLIVLALIAGISQGVFGVSTVTLTQIVTIGLFSATVVVPSDRVATYQVLAPWLVTSILAGLIGAWLRGTSRVSSATDSSSYESARRLLSQLRTVAKQLPSGLDLIGLANQTLTIIGRHTGAGHAAVFLRTEGGLLAPVAFTDQIARDRLSPTDALISDCWMQMEPTSSSARRLADGPIREAWPLRVGSRMIGVAMTEIQEGAPRTTSAVLMKSLDEHSLRLDAALTFDEIRSNATVEERRRLAREIHDGIAQEVASLGYLVDDLQASAESERQRAELAMLRGELSRVVNELRLSIFDLRSELLVESGLGAALSDYLRQVGARADLTVHLKLNEAATRMRVEVEAELLRMAGEAITNARKHSGAENLWVDCTVQPPFAEIEIRDDGRGLKPGRNDAYGLRIMQERARRIDARLEVTALTEDSEHPGTRVRITVGNQPVPASTVKDDSDDAPAPRHGLAAGRP